MNINTHAIAQKGGLVDSDDDFVVVACTKCGTQFLYNEETLLGYYDPEDLKRTFLDTTIDCPPCPSCGDEDWDFTICDSESAVRDGRWAWILE